MTKNYFQWKPEYSVGVKLLDYDHQELFETVNELHAAISDGRETDVINPVIDRLSRYVMEHFQREEHVMMEYSYPDINSHRQRHHEFARMIYSVRRILVSDPERISYQKLLRFLERWLQQHIQEEDMGYRNYIRGDYANRSTDIKEPLTEMASDALPAEHDKRKTPKWVAVTVHVPVEDQFTIKRCARLLQLGDEKADALHAILDPVGAINDEEALEIAKAVLKS